MQQSLICEITKENTTSFLVHFKKVLKHYFSSPVHNGWISALEIAQHSNESLVISTQTQSFFDSITRNIEKVTQVFNREYETFFNASCNLEILPPEANSPQNLPVTSNFTTQPLTNHQTNLDPKFTFANFIATEENLLTFHTVKGIAEKIQSGQNGSFVCITGTIGNGKTHILQSIGNYVAKNASVQYMTTERFMFLYTKAVANRNTIAFRESMASCQLLLIDDIHFILSKDGTMKELASTIRHILSFGGNVVITSATAIHAMLGISGDIQSTFSRANVVNIENPSFALRLKILEYKNNAFNYNVSSEVLHMLAEKITSNVRDLETTFDKIILHAKILNNEIDINAAKMVLKEIFPSTAFKTVSIKTILEAICTFYGVKKEDILSQSRLKEFVIARQMGMYLALEMTNETAKKIGFEFGGRTHSTVIHSYKSIKADCDSHNMQVLKNIEFLKLQIYNS